MTHRSNSRQRCVGYLRVSTRQQVGGTSPEHQEAALRSFAAANNLDLICVHSDLAVSGTSESREGIDAVLALVRAGEVDVVLTYRINRLLRSMAAFGTVIGTLEKYRVPFLSCTEQYDDSPSGRLGRNVQIAVSIYELEEIRGKTMDGRRNVVRDRGGWPGGPPPFGTQLERIMAPNRRTILVEHEVEAETIRTAIACLVDEAMTTGQTAKHLNAAGMLSRKDVRWSDTMLRKQLLRLTGLSGLWTFTQNDGVQHTIATPAIVTPERHQQLLAVLAASANGPKVKNTSHLLRARLVSECGHVMHAEHRQSKPSGGRYLCSHRRANGVDACDCRAIPINGTDERVWAHVLALLTDPRRLQELAGLLVDEHTDRVGLSDVGVLDARITKLASRLRIEVPKLLDLGLDAETIAELTRGLNDDIATLRIQRATAAKWEQSRTARKTAVEQLRQLSQTAAANLADAEAGLRQRIVGLLDLQVTVTDYAECSGCAGSGVRVVANPAGRGAFGPQPCLTCEGFRILPRLLIRGLVPQATSITEPAASKHPFVLHEAS